MKLRLTAFALVLAAGCGGGDSQDSVLSNQDCNPLGGQNCITPWPSSIYTVDDDTTETGRSLDIPMGALPTNVDDITVDPGMFNGRDGFSPAAPMLFTFPTGVDPSNLITHENYPASLGADSPTVLIDMSTGERVAHFSEVDIRDPGPTVEPELRYATQPIYIRPASRLKSGTRYAVGIRKSLKARDGSELPISEGFQAILDDRSTKHLRLEAIRPRYTEIFSALDAAGIAKDDLVLAWDFTTATDASMQRDLLSARDTVLSAVGTDGANLSYAIETDEPMDNPGIRRRVIGTFSVPLMLNQDGKAVPGTELVRDERGLPAIVGMHPVNFTAIVPECAYERALADGPRVGAIVYGHGLLGDHSQADGGSQQETAAQTCNIMIGTDMRGMSNIDTPNVIESLNNFNKAPWLFTTLIQGIMNHTTLVQALRGPMAESLFVDGEGRQLLDPEKIYYYGLSQGHIFGGTVVAYDPHIKRAVLGVGGSNYSMMLERSLDWPIYRNTVIGAYEDPLNVAIIINLMQMSWDTTEPSSIPTLNGIPGTPDKQYLLHMAIGDDEVPNISTEYQARSMGIGVLAPAVYEPWGVPETEGPLASALVIWDGGDGPIPVGNEAPADNNAHSMTRGRPASIEQIGTFFETGEIVHTCGEGTVCDCTTTACGDEE